jgi:hypothetical protein
MIAQDVQNAGEDKVWLDNTSLETFTKPLPSTWHQHNKTANRNLEHYSKLLKGDVSLTVDVENLSDLDAESVSDNDMSKLTCEAGAEEDADTEDEETTVHDTDGDENLATQDDVMEDASSESPQVPSAINNFDESQSTTAGDDLSGKEDNQAAEPILTKSLACPKHPISLLSSAQWVTPKRTPKNTVSRKTQRQESPQKKSSKLRSSNYFQVLDPSVAHNLSGSSGGTMPTNSFEETDGGRDEDDEVYMGDNDGYDSEKTQATRKSTISASEVVVDETNDQSTRRDLRPPRISRSVLKKLKNSEVPQLGKKLTQKPESTNNATSDPTQYTSHSGDQEGAPT